MKTGGNFGVSSQNWRILPTNQMEEEICKGSIEIQGFFFHYLSFDPTELIDRIPSSLGEMNTQMLALDGVRLTMDHNLLCDHSLHIYHVTHIW